MSARKSATCQARLWVGETCASILLKTMWASLRSQLGAGAGAWATRRRNTCGDIGRGRRRLVRHLETCFQLGEGMRTNRSGTASGELQPSNGGVDLDQELGDQRLQLGDAAVIALAWPLTTLLSNPKKCDTPSRSSWHSAQSRITDRQDQLCGTRQQTHHSIHFRGCHDCWAIVPPKSRARRLRTREVACRPTTALVTGQAGNTKRTDG